jgi:[ribosomal protein S5]-alanine N-acetyltransferase
MNKKRTNKIRKIKGSKFVLRPYKTSDAKGLAEVANNIKIAQNMVNTFPHPYTLKEAKNWVKLAMGPKKNKTNFVIDVNGKIAGGVGFDLKEGLYEGVASGGYWLGEKYWGKGIATEAWKLIRDYAFQNFNIRRLEAGVFSWNPASARVQEKCGFKKEGIKRESVIRFGKVGDKIMYGLVREEWEKLQKRY